MRAIDRKVLRDLSRMRGQLLPIALILACGLGVFYGMRSTMRSLEVARSDYYASARFGHVFASLVRAPEGVAERLRAIPGVVRVETRVVAGATLDVPGMVEAATGKLVSIPDHGTAGVNDLVLVDGRMPEGADEVLASEAFVEGQDFPLDGELSAVVDGKHQRLRVVGVALSPEFTYALGPGQLFPDDRRFGIFWMRRRALAAAFDQEGAFNDVSLRVGRDANLEQVLDRVDAVLEPYGCLGAVGRDEQQSAFFVENELSQLRTFSVLIPVLFLVVAGFLLNVAIGRIVASQRVEIAALKAFGYRDREVGAHYARIVGGVVLLGSAGGLWLGNFIGGWMTGMYTEYYRFPSLDFRFEVREIGWGLGIAVAAAAIGAGSAIAHVVALPPAEGMRPPAPPSYRATLLERLGLSKVVPSSWRIVLRELERRPLRAAFSVFGIAMATALCIVNSFSYDAIRHVLNVQFGLLQREDVTLTLVEPRALGALTELEHLPGVLHAEPYRAAPVRLRNGLRDKALAITGVPRGAKLSALVDVDLVDVPIPPDGLAISRKLADLLGVEVGDVLDVEVLEGERRRTEVRVARIVEAFLGLTANMELGALARLLGETETMNRAALLVDDARLDELHEAVKAVPLVQGVTARDTLLSNIVTLLDENLGTMLGIGVFFSLVMAFGVLYNAARVTLAERSRELASLRVLGFRRGEVARILLGELGLLVAVATPLGLVVGTWFAALLASSPGFDSEQFRIPLVVAPATYLRAVLVVLAAAVVSGWSAWRRLDAVDLVEVLKSRE